MFTELDYNNSLYHHGIKGQKWGVRRFQNEDGTYTQAGKDRRNDNYDADYEYESYKKDHDYSDDPEFKKTYKKDGSIKGYKTKLDKSENAEEAISKVKELIKEANIKKKNGEKIDGLSLRKETVPYLAEYGLASSIQESSKRGSFSLSYTKSRR